MFAINYYSVKNMDCPTMELYQVKRGAKVLLVGTARKQPWAFTIDIDPNSPADMICDGCNTPFEDKSFDLVILDFVTNFMPPSRVNEVIKEANRIGMRVVGRCHFADDGRTLRGSKQAYCHKVIPNGVEWIEIRKH